MFVLLVAESQCPISVNQYHQESNRPVDANDQGEITPQSRALQSKGWGQRESNLTRKVANFSPSGATRCSGCERLAWVARRYSGMVGGRRSQNSGQKPPREMTADREGSLSAVD